MQSIPQVQPRPWRAWCYLVWFSVRQQARARLLVWTALGLLALITLVAALNTRMNRWGMWHWRKPRGLGPNFLHSLYDVSAIGHAGWDPPAQSVASAVTGAFQVVLDHSGFIVFSNYVVFSIFATFLLPLWSLTFAAEALGREREAGNLIWLLARPLPRWSVYLGKFLAALPWSLALNLGGFGVLCFAGGESGQLAWRVYWPAVLWGTLAFCALFHLFGVLFRRPAIVGILYAFFLETLVGNLPGYLKRASISFYTRCLMFDAAHGFGVQPEQPAIYLPVAGTTAWVVLAGFTVGLLLVGMIVFSRSEYLDLS